MQWNSNNPHYLTLNEVHKLFIDYFLKLSASFVKKDKDDGFDFGDRSVTGSSGSDTCKEVKSSVSIEEWVEVWGEFLLPFGSFLHPLICTAGPRSLLSVPMPYRSGHNQSHFVTESFMVVTTH